MGNYARFSLAALTAALVLFVGSGSAFALRSLSLLPIETAQQGTSPAFTFTTGGIEITCAVSIEKTMSSRIPKINGVLMGSGTMATSGCRASGESVTITALAPDRLFYAGFLGRLPNITAIKLRAGEVGILVRLRLLGVTVECLFGGEYEVELTLNARVQIISIAVSAEARLRLIRKLSGLIECPTTLGLAGTLRLTTPIPVSLI